MEVRMARVIEQILAVKISRIVKDHSDDVSVTTDEQEQALKESIPQLVEGLLDDPSVVVELVDLE